MATTTALRRTRIDLAGASTRLIEADLSQPLAFAILTAVFFALRAPFIKYGHGTDPDAWRVAVTSHYLIDNLKYFPSRLPGNPLHELVTALLIPGGWVATDLATAGVSLVGVYLFARIVKQLGLPNPGLLTIGFAFTPLLFINSISTMDYMWALTCLLGAYYCALRGLPLWAGVLVGCAIAFRLQSVITLAPFAFLFWRQRERRSIIPFGFAAGGVAALAFAPVLATYGLRFLNFYDAKVDYQDIVRLLAKESLGIIGCLGVLAGAALSFRRLKELPFDLRHDVQVAFWVVFIGFEFFSFFRLPHEIGYLIPVFPFGLIIMGRYFTRTALIGAIGAIIFAGVIDVTTHGENVSLSAIKGASIGHGLVLSNRDTMRAQRDFTHELLSADVPDHSVVMAGFIFPQLAVRGRDHLELKILQRDYEAISMLTDRGEAVDEKHDVRYVWLLTYDTFMALRSQGYSFFMVPDAVGGTAALYKYRPTLFGATFLYLEQSAPSVSKGTASTDR